MKTKIFMLLIFLSPLLLFGINMHAKSNPGFKNRYHDFKNQSQLMVNKNPALRLNSSASKDREWRLAQILTQYDWDWKQDRVLVNSDLFDYYYNATQPARVDSIVRYGWNVNDLSWGYQDTSVYFYDPSGYITELQVRDIHSTDIPIKEKYLCFYDGQHRLTEVHEYFNDSWFDRTLQLYIKRYFSYDNNRLAQITYIDTEDYPYCFYNKAVFTHDTQGRIVAGNVYDSSDSLNWDLSAAISITYQANDTSTGADYVSFLAHNYLNDQMYSEYEGLVSCSLISEYIIYADWFGTYWEEGDKYVFTYNASNQVASATSHDWEAWEASWELSELYSYSYDANNKLSQVSEQYWDSDLEAWGAFMGLKIYTWQQHSGADENTVPPISSNLSVYPNPMHSSLYIEIKNSQVPAQVSIYNLKGQLVREMTVNPGVKAVWDGKDKSGRPLGNGIYFCKVKSGKFASTTKVVLLK